MRSDAYRRAVLVGAGLLALLVVVALATRGNLGGSEGGPGPGGGFVDYVFTVFLVVFVLLIPFAIWLYWMQRDSLVYEAAQQRKQRRYGNIVTALFLIGLALWIQYLRTHRGDGGIHLKPPKAQIPKGSQVAKGGGAEPIFQWWLAALIVGLVVVGAATAFVLVRRANRRAVREAQTASRGDLARARRGARRPARGRPARGRDPRLRPPRAGAGLLRVPT